MLHIRFELRGRLLIPHDSSSWSWFSTKGWLVEASRQLPGVGGWGWVSCPAYPAWVVGEVAVCCPTSIEETQSGGPRKTWDEVKLRRYFILGHLVGPSHLVLLTVVGIISYGSHLRVFRRRGTSQERSGITLRRLCF